MGFQTKLILTYSLFIIVLVIILGTIFYEHSARVFEANAYSNLTVVSDKMSKQFERLILPMEFISEELLSDSKFISSLTSLAKLDRNNIKSEYYIDDARQTISFKLLTYSIIKNFYQVTVFNNKGDFLSSSIRNNYVDEDFSTIIQGLKWKKSADMAKGNKIVLQQIVENSVNHGFANGQKIVKVDIKGYVIDGWWYIDCTDNGQGFELEILNKLEKRMESMKTEITKGESKTGFAIGGMGLINTFGRLVLFYNNKLAFTLKNLENGGAKVTIGGIVGMLEEAEDK